VPCKLNEKGKLPQHTHGVYSKVKFGVRDESEAISDYTILKKHLKSRKSRKILSHIIREEAQHKRMFGAISKLECPTRKVI
jgi:rubrerythrin